MCLHISRFQRGCRNVPTTNPGIATKHRPTGEDDLADTAKPRLRAAGADLKRVHYIEKVKVVGKTTQTERRDMQKPQQAINQFPETKLIVIDPLSNYLGDTKMLNRAGSACRARASQDSGRNKHGGDPRGDAPQQESRRLR